MNQLFFQRNTIFLLLFLGTASLSFGQCGTEVPTISDYCPDQYAEFDIANSDPAIKYSWYDKIAGPDTAEYGYYNHFISPDPYPGGTGAVDFYYQKEISVTGGPQTSPAPNYAGSGPTQDAATGTSYEVSVNAEVDFKLNSITVALQFYFCRSGKNLSVKSSGWH